MVAKDYKERDIREEINKKIEGFNRTRDNRIHASERLYSYSNKWDSIFFVMNILAVVFLIFSLMNVESHKGLFISSCFSLYAVILQYYYNTLNYKERALRFHYQQLEIEKYILELKKLLRVVQDDSELEKQYDIIWNKYLITLLGTENHSRFDDEEVLYDREKSTKKLKKPRDFSLDNFLFYINFILIMSVTVFYFVG
ncbi:SLATT domain-containing protein [Lactococcus lactis]|uniref:SLATT domain-containing protein n=1 Tax=Lactococcus lactis TaxID=1358 RepID=UPI002078EBEE|nr:SLATT domain-containing protein [Lactococcus lactis]USI48124.1 SLATT domain-containing protein [Lactococcus lactis]